MFLACGPGFCTQVPKDRDRAPDDGAPGRGDGLELRAWRGFRKTPEHSAQDLLPLVTLKAAQDDVGAVNWHVLDVFEPQVQETVPSQRRKAPQQGIARGRSPPLSSPLQDLHCQGRSPLMGRSASLEGGHYVIRPLLVKAAVEPGVGADSTTAH